MSSSDADRAVLERTQEVEIETQAPDGPAHQTVIWVVVDREETFIRSYRGDTARWYREALANPAVTVHADGPRLAATAIPASDADSIDRGSSPFRRKYAGDPAIGAMIRPETLATTLRLEPA
jgi:hypothetical protein